MIYDYRFAPLFVLLLLGPVLVYQGAVAVKTATMELPFGGGRRLQGSHARLLGALSFLAGLGALALLARLLVSAAA